MSALHYLDGFIYSSIGVHGVGIHPITIYIGRHLYIRVYQYDISNTCILGQSPYCASSQSRPLPSRTVPSFSLVTCEGLHVVEAY
jgi:hypothetical protein